MAGSAALEVEPLLGVLEGHGVDYIVIGGFAVAAHGFPRATKDFDICPNPEPANLDRLANALKELEAVPLDLHEFEDEFELKPNLEGLQLGGNWTLMTKHGRLDLMQTFGFEDADDRLGGYADIAKGAVTRTLFGRECRFCSYEDLLSMKRVAGRDQDHIDVSTLKQARREV